MLCLVVKLERNNLTLFSEKLLLQEQYLLGYRTKRASTTSCLTVGTRSPSGQLGIQIQSKWSDMVANWHRSSAMHWLSTLPLSVNLQTLTASQILTCSNGKHPTDAQVLHCSLCSIRDSLMPKDTLLRCMRNHHGYTHSGSPREGLMVI